MFSAFPFSPSVAPDSVGFGALLSVSLESVLLLSFFASLSPSELLSFAASVGLTVLLSFAVLPVQAVMVKADNAAISSVCFKRFFFHFLSLLYF